MTSYLKKTFQNAFGSSDDKEKMSKKENGASEPADETSDTGSSQEADCNGLEEVERSKIGIIRALLRKEDPSSVQEEDVDDPTIRRFLRARDLDVEKACAMLLKYLTWRREFVPKGFISLSEIQNDIAQNKLFMQGNDKLGRPIVVVFGGRHKQTTVDEFKRTQNLVFSTPIIMLLSSKFSYSKYMLPTPFVHF